VLVDGGPGGAVLRGLGREMPWHDRSIDLVVLTHPQADHANGLIDVFARYDVRAVLTGAAFDQSTTSRMFVRAAEREHAGVERAQAGDTLDLGGGITIEVLSAGIGSSNANDNALVLMLRWHDVSFLLTGDIETEAEQQLVDSGIDLRATMLKVAHHGSHTSSTGAFLDAVRPEIAVVSAGAENRYGHPNGDVMQRLASYSTVVTTAERGSVHLETDGRRLWVRTQR
jgi:competence protein ComEC